MKINWKLRSLGLFLLVVSASRLASRGISVFELDYWIINFGAYVGGMLVTAANKEV